MRSQKTVVCVDDSYPYITKGNKYDVFEESETRYLIEDDSNSLNIFLKSDFITLIEMRDKVINSLLCSN